MKRIQPSEAQTYSWGTTYPTVEARVQASFPELRYPRVDLHSSATIRNFSTSSKSACVIAQSMENMMCPSKITLG